MSSIGEYSSVTILFVKERSELPLNVLFKVANSCRTQPNPHMSEALLQASTFCSNISGAKYATFERWLFFNVFKSLT